MNTNSFHGRKTYSSDAATSYSFCNCIIKVLIHYRYTELCIMGTAVGVNTNVYFRGVQTVASEPHAPLKYDMQLPEIG